MDIYCTGGLYHKKKLSYTVHIWQLCYLFSIISVIQANMKSSKKRKKNTFEYALE